MGNKRRRFKPIKITERLNKPISISVNGEVEKVSPFEAGLLSTVAKAGRGDMRAAQSFMEESEKAGIFERSEANEDCGLILRVPKDWELDELKAMFDGYGPPPWQGERNGLPRTRR